MAGITLDRAVLISIIVETLLYGNRPRYCDPRSVTNDVWPGILTIMFGFTLWVLIYERGGGINKRLLLTSLVIFALATAVSELLAKSMPRS